MGKSTEDPAKVFALAIRDFTAWAQDFLIDEYHRLYIDARNSGRLANQETAIYFALYARGVARRSGRPTPEFVEKYFDELGERPEMLRLSSRGGGPSVHRRALLAARNYEDFALVEELRNDEGTPLTGDQGAFAYVARRRQISPATVKTKYYATLKALKEQASI